MTGISGQVIIHKVLTMQLRFVLHVIALASHCHDCPTSMPKLTLAQLSCPDLSLAYSPRGQSWSWVRSLYLLNFVLEYSLFCWIYF